MSRSVDNERFARSFQATARRRGYPLVVDGHAGRRTLAAYERFSRRSDPPWPEDTDEALTAFYGPRGDESALVSVPVRWKTVLAWQTYTSVRRFRVHRLCAESFARILDRLAREFPTQPEIEEVGLDRFGGIYKLRRMRGGSKWSRHSWGIAVDFDPKRNPLRAPWPDVAPMDIRIIEAFESEGWKSYARIRGIDAMHFQATL